MMMRAADDEIDVVRPRVSQYLVRDVSESGRDFGAPRRTAALCRQHGPVPHRDRLELIDFVHEVRGS
jgi:hypothetical protein